MKAEGSKRKGASFERDMAVKLSLWISNGEREDLLWRSSMSGGRSTVAKKKGKDLSSSAGDLSSINAESQAFINKFFLECKHYQDIYLIGLIVPSGHLYKFWQTAVTQANSYKKYPMLIAKQNRLQPIVFLQIAGLKLLKLNEAQSVISSHRHGMFGYLLEDFLKWAKPL